MERENVILFDMDGTLCDYDKALFQELEKLRNPLEKPITNFRNLPDYLQNRTDIIRKSEEW